MSVLVNPFVYGFASYAPGVGVLAFFGSNATITTSAEIPFDSEVYDSDAYHSSGTNPERLAVPGGVGRGRFQFCGLNSVNVEFIARKNGASFAGRGSAYSDSAAGNDSATGVSAIVAVSPGDYFTVFQNSSFSGTGQANACWVSFEPIGPALRGALVQRTSDLALTAATTTTVGWDSEVYDTDGFHDNVTNNSRLTVPSGFSLVRICAGVRVTGAGTQSVISFLKNGAGARGLPAMDKDMGTADDYHSVASAVLAVSAADYFELQAFATLAGTVKSDDASWFQIEEIPADRKYAVVHKSSSQTISTSTNTIVTFNAELADTDGFHDNVTNNSRLTVPSGCTEARLSFNVRTPSASGQMVARVLKNGTAYHPGLPLFETDTPGTDSLNGFGAWVPVTPGDYFELDFYQQSGANMTLADDNALWFCIEAR